MELESSSTVKKFPNIIWELFFISFWPSYVKFVPLKDLKKIIIILLVFAEECIMSETRKNKKNKKKSLFSINLDFLKVVRLVFLIFLAVCLVYLYYLHTKGILLSTMDSLWKKHQKMIEMILGITAYTGFVYYLGYQKGKKG